MTAPSAMDIGVCPWLCGGPNYPHTPFAWPVFTIVDTLRVLIAVGAVLLVLASIWAIPRATIRGQRCRFLGYVGAGLFIAGTEIQHLGDVPHWRFLVGLVTVPIALYGVHQHLFREMPARDVQPRGSARP